MRRLDSWTQVNTCMSFSLPSRHLRGSAASGFFNRRILTRVNCRHDDSRRGLQEEGRIVYAWAHHTERKREDDRIRSTIAASWMPRQSAGLFMLSGSMFAYALCNMLIFYTRIHTRGFYQYMSLWRRLWRWEQQDWETNSYRASRRLSQGEKTGI